MDEKKEMDEKQQTEAKEATIAVAAAAADPSDGGDAEKAASAPKAAKASEASFSPSPPPHPPGHAHTQDDSKRDASQKQQHPQPAQPPAEAPPLFVKPRAFTKGRVRKRERDDHDQDQDQKQRPTTSAGDGDLDQEPHHQEKGSIGEVQMLQRMRERRKGLSVEVMNTTMAREREEEKAAEEEEEQYGLLDRQFASAGMGGAGRRGNEAMDQHLEEFLRERLDVTEDKGDEAPQEKTREQELYEIPPELRIKDATEEHAEKMNWVTGLVEVPLPIEYKLKNIEATEKAKREKLQLGGQSVAASGRPWAPAAAAGGAAAADAGDEGLEVVHKAFGSRFFNPHRPKSQMATDDQTLERFRKRFRGR
ncbi:unnamed protein product [Vitrella brassicaformis CCMP3155]|uniref:Hepatocellular carcinoma-associated antigen 59-domain-containing protein n=1 Tax=Vitrella brassicaformis (strain CCMP3155) TaxID=1169540 RepID=A0A0G4FK68_VITBC|nr:unnamed protein product [Vitrella brassicaformis CCMP3155]|eukprot:CEM14109.1 unnamed protein product [Vitrella brassicaformis CCMP3155]